MKQKQKNKITAFIAALVLLAYIIFIQSNVCTTYKPNILNPKDSIFTN